MPSEDAPTWVSAEPPSLQAVAAAAATPVTGPGIVPGEAVMVAVSAGTLTPI